MSHLYAFLLLAVSVSFVADASADLRGELVAMESQDSLDQATLSPWHMKISFRRWSSPALSSESGTIDIWWLSPANSSIILKTDTATAIRVTKDEQISTSATPIPAVDLDLVDLFVSPFRQISRIANTTLRPTVEQYASSTLHCIVSDDASPGSINVSYLTLCPTPDGKAIRLLQRWVAQTVLVSRSGTFQGKSVPVDLQIANGKTLFLQAHLDQLGTIKPSDVPSFPEPLSPSESVCDHVKAPPRLPMTSVSTGPRFNQPLKFQSQRASSHARLRVVVGTTGHVQCIDVLQATDAGIASSAMESIRHETFIPAKSADGNPIACSIVMAFNVFAQ